MNIFYIINQENDDGIRFKESVSRYIRNSITNIWNIKVIVILEYYSLKYKFKALNIILSFPEFI